MNLTALKPKTSKGTGLVNGNSKVIEPFYIDRNAEKTHAKQSTDVMAKLNQVCYVWQSVTGKPILNENEFKDILEDPAKHWRSDKFQEHVEQKREGTLYFIDEGYDETEIQKLLKLPKGFNEVFDAIKRAKHENINWKNFTWVENSFQLSQYYMNRIDGKVHHRAITPLQQKRLEKARQLLDCVQDLEELMIEECREAGIPEAKIARAKKSQQWIGPLPYALRFEHVPDPTNDGWLSASQKVVVNEKWVVQGLKQWADVIGLPGLTIKDRYVPKAHVPVIYLKFTRRDMDGARRLYIVPKHDRDMAYSGMGREAEVKFLPGEFIIDDNGKLVSNE